MVIKDITIYIPDILEIQNYSTHNQQVFQNDNAVVNVLYDEGQFEDIENVPINYWTGFIRDIGGNLFLDHYEWRDWHANDLTGQWLLINPTVPTCFIISFDVNGTRYYITYLGVANSFMEHYGMMELIVSSIRTSSSFKQSAPPSTLSVMDTATSDTTTPSSSISPAPSSSLSVIEPDTDLSATPSGYLSVIEPDTALSAIEATTTTAVCNTNTVNVRTEPNGNRFIGQINRGG